MAIAEAVRIYTEVTGERPLGFYQGRSSEKTILLAMEEDGFVYLSDTYADDLPYWMEGLGGQHLIIPYTLDANDMRFATAQGFNCGDQFFTYLKDSFDTLYVEDVAGQAKMMNVGLHCRLVGRPGRAAALAWFIDYVKGHDKVWLPAVSTLLATGTSITSRPEGPLEIRPTPAERSRRRPVPTFAVIGYSFFSPS